jgi:N-acetylmuramoyl-L-alanine amidase CwlA
MNLQECIFYNSDNYNWNTTNSQKYISKVKGIVVHSTGANNPNLKRYVQPVKANKNYETLLADLGTNKYGNHWNRAGVNLCVHAFIGKTAKGKVATYQVLPFDRTCWGCGKAFKGSYNYNPNAHIQFEICEDNLTDEKYFNAAMTEAQEFCAYLCKKFNLDVSTVVSHAEAHKKGYASNHGDIDHWLKRHGKTMEWFRAQVKAKMSTDNQTVSTEKKETSTPSYRVGRALQLKNEKLYVSSTASTAKKTVSGTYYVWNNEIVNGRLRITVHQSYVGIAGMVTGWIDAPPLSFNNGEIVKLEKTPLYISAVAKTASLKRTGTFFIWDKEIINGRIRITNKYSNVGVEKQVTGWVNVSDI